MKRVVRPSFLIALFGLVALILTAQAADKISGGFHSGSDSDMEKAVANRISSQEHIAPKSSVSAQLMPESEAKADELFDSLATGENKTPESGTVKKSVEAVKRKVQEIVPSPVTSRQSAPSDVMAELGFNK